MTRDCPYCNCESPEDRKARQRREEDERQRKEREIEFARRHSVLTDDDIAWARKRLGQR